MNRGAVVLPRACCGLSGFLARGRGSGLALGPWRVRTGSGLVRPVRRAAHLAVDHAYIDALRRGEEPVDARLSQDWLSGPHRSNLAQARGL